MATIAQIRAGLKTRLSTITGWQVSAYILALPLPPTIWVFPEQVAYDATMQRGTDLPRFKVQAFVALVSDIGGQQKLDTLLAPTGATSVKTAIEADKSLGGVIDDLQVTEATNYGPLVVAGLSELAIGCDWTVSIID